MEAFSQHSSEPRVSSKFSVSARPFSAIPYKLVVSERLSKAMLKPCYPLRGIILPPPSTPGTKGSKMYLESPVLGLHRVLLPGAQKQLRNNLVSEMFGLNKVE